MTSFILKLIAITTMLIDHIGAVLIPQNSQWYLVFRMIGRLAFPIFVFLIVEGFYHTKDIKKYLKRLGIFALISEIPFDLAFYNYMYREDISVQLKRVFELITQQKFNSELSDLVTTIIGRGMKHQNVFFTLFLGLLLITLMNQLEQKYKNKIIILNILEALFVIVFSIIAFILRTDYNYAGILLIVAFYLFRTSKILMTLSLLFIMGFVLGGEISLYATISMIFIALYNGKKGKDIKYIFYIFYPAHLFLLYLINTL